MRETTGPWPLGTVLQVKRAALLLYPYAERRAWWERTRGPVLRYERYQDRPSHPTYAVVELDRLRWLPVEALEPVTDAPPSTFFSHL